MSELFDIPESLSPRLQWMRRHGITTSHDANATDAEAWLAYHRDTVTVKLAEDEESALAEMAKELGIKTWKEAM